MPNLISHIIYAEDILQNLHNKELNDIINQERALYYLGSVFPDIFYYYFLGVPHLSHLDGVLHDYPKPRTCEIIKKMVEELKDLPWPDRAKISFAMGFITHIAAENILHPVVFYFTGNYYDTDSRERLLTLASHRQFEKYLDLYLMRASSKKLSEFNLGKIIGIPRAKRRRVFDFFSAIIASISGNSPENISAAIKRAYPTLLFLNYLFSNRLFYRLMSFLNLFNNPIVNPYFQLFYPHQPQTPLPEIFNTPFIYRNPITGEERKTSMPQLRDEVGQIGGSALNDAYSFISGRGDEKPLLTTLNKLIHSGKLKYFSPSRFS